MSRDTESADGILGYGKQIAPLLAVELENGYERSVILGRVEYGCQEGTKGRDKRSTRFVASYKDQMLGESSGGCFLPREKGRLRPDFCTIVETAALPSVLR